MYISDFILKVYRATEDPRNGLGIIYIYLKDKLNEINSGKKLYACMREEETKQN